MQYFTTCWNLYSLVLRQRDDFENLKNLVKKEKYLKYRYLHSLGVHNQMNYDIYASKGLPNKKGSENIVK